MKSTLTLILCIMFSYSACLAQQDALGVELGYGKSYFGDSQLFPFGYNSFDSYKVGCKYYRTPVRAPFSFCAEISYLHNQSDNAKLDFLNIPFGFQLDFGKRIHFIAGASLNLKVLIYYNDAATERVYHLENDLNKTQIAWSFWGGLGYKINEKLDICFSYVNTHDISSLFTIPTSSPGGAKYELFGRSSIGVVNCSLKFTINKKD